MDLSSLEGDGQVNGLVLEEGKAHLILSSKFILNLFLNLGYHSPLCPTYLQRGSRAEEVQLFSINSLRENG